MAESLFKTFSVPVEVDVPIDAADLTNSLSPLELIELILEIDGSISQWEFTELLVRRLSATPPPEFLQGMSDEDLSKAVSAGEEEE